MVPFKHTHARVRVQCGMKSDLGSSFISSLDGRPPHSSKAHEDTRRPHSKPLMAARLRHGGGRNWVYSNRRRRGHDLEPHGTLALITDPSSSPPSPDQSCLVSKPSYRLLTAYLPSRVRNRQHRRSRTGLASGFRLARVPTVSAVALPQLPNKCEGSSPDFLRCALALDPSTLGCEARLAQRAGETGVQRSRGVSQSVVLSRRRTGDSGRSLLEPRCHHHPAVFLGRAGPVVAGLELVTPFSCFVKTVV